MPAGYRETIPLGGWLTPLPLPDPAYQFQVVPPPPPFWRDWKTAILLTLRGQDAPL
jgi:hypothetical protein